MNDDNDIELARRILAAFGAHDDNVLDELIHDHRGHARMEPQPGREGIRGSIAWAGETFADHVHIWRVAEGRLAEHWMVRDDLAVLRQRGATEVTA